MLSAEICKNKFLFVLFQTEERVYLYNWLNAHRLPTQRLLLLFDNIDLPRQEYAPLYGLIDELMTSVRGLQLLCTCRSNFYHGANVKHDIYWLEDVGEAVSIQLLQLLCDRRAEDVVALDIPNTCAHVPFALRLVGNTFVHCSKTGGSDGSNFIKRKILVVLFTFIILLVLLVCGRRRML